MDKKNNNQVLEDLKNDLKKILKQIPSSEMELFLDFFKNVWAKIFVSKNNDKPLDIHSVISYIENKIKYSKNPIHKQFYAKIYKRLKKMVDELKLI